MSMKELLGMVTQDKEREDILLAPKARKAAREDSKQICIHGITRQTCSACARRSGT